MFKVWRFKGIWGPWARVQALQTIYGVMLLVGVRPCNIMGHGSSLRQREVRQWLQDQVNTAYSRYGGSRVYGAQGYSVQALWAVYGVVVLACVCPCNTMGHGSSLGQQKVRRTRGERAYLMCGGSRVYRAHGYSVQVLQAIYGVVPWTMIAPWTT